MGPVIKCFAIHIPTNTKIHVHNKHNKLQKTYLLSVGVKHLEILIGSPNHFLVSV